MFLKIVWRMIKELSRLVWGSYMDITDELGFVMGTILSGAIIAAFCLIISLIVGLSILIFGGNPDPIALTILLIGVSFLGLGLMTACVYAFIRYVIKPLAKFYKKASEEERAEKLRRDIKRKIEDRD